jgi:hypothetical protein
LLAPQRTECSLIIISGRGSRFFVEKGIERRTVRESAFEKFFGSWFFVAANGIRTPPQPPYRVADRHA